MTEEIPIRRLWKNRDRLTEAVDNSQWDEATAISKLIVNDIRLAINTSECIVEPPTLDGLYSIGTMRYTSAPEKTRRALNKMNRILRTAKMNIPKRRK